jgi:transposase-like protein
MIPLLHQDTGVSPTRTRRQFSTAYKRQILAEAAACGKPGELGALLRREGLYSSHLSVWRAAEQRGELRGPAKRRGPAPTPSDPAIKRIAALERELAEATARAERAELIIDAQKKFSQLLGLTLPTPDALTETRS